MWINRKLLCVIVERNLVEKGDKVEKINIYPHMWMFSVDLYTKKL